MDFTSNLRQLAGNHFITITSGLENLMSLGNLVLREGAQEIGFSFAYKYQVNTVSMVWLENPRKRQKHTSGNKCTMDSNINSEVRV